MKKIIIYRSFLTAAVIVSIAFAVMYIRSQEDLSMLRNERKETALYALTESLYDICIGSSPGACDADIAAGEKAAAQASVWMTQLDLTSEQSASLINFIRKHEKISCSDYSDDIRENMVSALENGRIDKFIECLDSQNLQETPEPKSIREYGGDLFGVRPSSLSDARKTMKTITGAEIDFKKASCDLIPPSYTVYCNNAYARISLNGGKILKYAYNCSFEGEYIDDSKCRKAADDFLEITVPKSKRNWVDIQLRIAENKAEYIYTNHRGKSAAVTVSRTSGKVIYFNSGDIYK